MTGAEAAAGARERRVALLREALRLSRTPDRLPRLEAALAALDEEAGVLRRVRERLAENMAPDAPAAWAAARRAEIEAAAATECTGGIPPAGAPRGCVEAMRAASELLARLEAGGTLETGAATAAGWRFAAGLALDGGGGLGWLPTALWALAPPGGEGEDGGAEPVFVAAGGHAPEVWRREEVRAELERRREALAAAEAFVRAVGAAAGPAPGGARGNTEKGREEDPMEDDMHLAEVRVHINVFGCPTRIARALGLDVELPDVDSRDPAYWDDLRRVGWKPQLRGKVADTEEERGDPDWLTLRAHAWGRVRFDLEEGVVVQTTVGGLLPALDAVHGLAARGVPLRDADGSALVWVMQSVFGAGVPDASAAFSAAGLVRKDLRRPTFFWELSPARWPWG